MKAKLFVVVGPSGVGKSYVMAALQKQYPAHFVVPKLLTTRQPRQGEEAIDREFISELQFETMRKNGEFMFSGNFNDNWYGYTHDSVMPKDRHILINAWGAMLPHFVPLPNLIIIGMTVLPENISLLQERIRQRQEPAEMFAKRLANIGIDLADIKKYDELIKQHGKLFEVADDSAAEEIIKWIGYNYL